MRPHDDTARPAGPSDHAANRTEEARRRIRLARATAAAVMEDRREAVRADFDERVRELDDQYATTDRPTAA